MGKDPGRPTICAVVVTYNRRDLLLRCLMAVYGQSLTPDAVCVVDNASTDGTAAAVEDAGYLARQWHRADSPNDEPARARECGGPPCMHYLRMERNSGSAGGFHAGIKWAYESGFDWVWVLDDDGFPAADCLGRLLEVAARGFDYLAPDLLDEDGDSHFAERWAYARTDVAGFCGGPFNAILLSRTLIGAVGYPLQAMFIWGDEYEYTDRIAEAGFPLVTVRAAKHHHRRTAVDFRTCTRGYYLVRNNIYRARLFRGISSPWKPFAAVRVYAGVLYIIRCLVRMRFAEALTAARGLVRGCLDPLEEEQVACCWWGVETFGARAA